MCRPRRHQARWCLALFTLAAALGLPGAPAIASSLPNTTSGIHLGLAFGYPRDWAPPARADYIWGGGTPSSATYIEGYFPFDVDWVVARRGYHDFGWWRRHHPDWIVYRCNRRTPAYYGDSPQVPLDMSNPNVRRYQLAKALSLLSQGYSGVDIDNFTLTNYQSRCGAYRHGVWKPLHYQQNGFGGYGDAQLIKDMIAWLRFVSDRVHGAYPGATVTVNSSVMLDGGVEFARRLEPYVDGVFDEGSFTQSGAGRLTDEGWQTEVAWAEELARNNKAFVLNELLDDSGDSAVTSSQLNWALANYLLVKGEHTYTYVYGNVYRYGTYYDRPAYHVPIGHPISARYERGMVQFRDYSGGETVVNPSSTTTYEVQLPGAYTDTSGGLVLGSIILPPASGVVLLRTGGPQGASTVKSQAIVRQTEERK